MTVYARSDIAAVTVGRSHGGCGEVHSRPVVNGAPARTWGLTCPPCEAHLTHDPAWSGTLADVPSTPDEDLARESAVKKTISSRDDIMALALAKIAGLPVAEYLTGMVGKAVDSGTVLCNRGHENFPQSKFCGECGAPLGEVITLPAAEASTELEPVSAPVKPTRRASQQEAARQPATQPPARIRRERTVPVR